MSEKETETNKTDETTNKTNEEAISSKGAKSLVFDEWVKQQDEDVQLLINKRFEALENSVKSTRRERDDLARQIKEELLPKVEKGSELEKSLTTFSEKLEVAERRATFAEEAIKPEIGCTNVKAAYALALAENLFDSRGNPKWAEIKQTAPELFRKPGSTDGGTGGGKTPAPSDINAAIRKAAGRD